MMSVASSSIVMTSGQSMISKSAISTAFCAAAARIFSALPVRMICTPSSSAAMRQPLEDFRRRIVAAEGIHNNPLFCHVNHHSSFFVPVGEADYRFARRGKGTKYV